jgi:ribonuclease E
VPAPETADAAADFLDEPFDLIEPSEAPAARPAGEESDERPRRRRRRRRGGGESDRPRRPAEGAEDERTVRRPPAEEPVAEDAAAEGEPEEGPGQERRDEEGPQRGGRHRFRHGRKTRTGEKAAVADRDERSAARASKPSAVAESGGPEDLEMDLDIGEDEEGGDEGQSRAEPAERAGFRGIPTWEETVGMLITKNMEARSRRPEGGSSYGRNSRGGQGGRRRS